MIPLAISAYTTVSTLGRGAAAALAALREERSGLQPCDFADAVLPTWVGAVAGLDETPLSGAWAEYDCRNNRLACMALQHDDFAAAVAVAVARYGASRVGVFHDLMQRMIVGALRGRPIQPGEPPMTDRERLLGDVLSQIWFAVMIGWASGLQTQASIHERMRASVELVLDDPHQGT